MKQPCNLIQRTRSREELKKFHNYLIVAKFGKDWIINLPSINRIQGRHSLHINIDTNNINKIIEACW